MGGRGGSAESARVEVEAGHPGPAGLAVSLRVRCHSVGKFWTENHYKTLDFQLLEGIHDKT